MAAPKSPASEQIYRGRHTTHTGHSKEMVLWAFTSQLIKITKSEPLQLLSNNHYRIFLSLQNPLSPRKSIEVPGVVQDRDPVKYCSVLQFIKDFFYANPV